jgi:hypothetical protein
MDWRWFSAGVVGGAGECEADENAECAEEGEVVALALGGLARSDV